MMDTRRLVRRAGTGLVAALMCWPAGTALADDEGELPGDVDTTCLEVLEGHGAHEVSMETDPPEGDTVEAGQTVTARITWPVDDFAADVPLYATLGCVTVDGRLDQSLTDRQAVNDGEFSHTWTVPSGLAAGAEICDRGAVAGNGGGYFERNKSNDVCFTVAESTVQSGAAGPAPPAAPVVGPEVSAAPGVMPSADVLGTSEEQTSVAPATAPAVAPQALEQLPRTGRDGRPLAALAGFLLVLGGAAIRGSTVNGRGCRTRLG